MEDVNPYRKDQVVTSLLQGSIAIFIPCVDNIVASLYQPCNNLATCKVVVSLEQGCDKVVTTFPEGCRNPGFVMPSIQFQGCSKVLTRL